MKKYLVIFVILACAVNCAFAQTASSKADLIFEIFKVNATSIKFLQPFTVTYTLKNNGTANAGASTTGFYIMKSLNGLGKCSIGTENELALPKDKSITKTVPLSLKSFRCPSWSGDAYIGVCADKNSEVSESDKYCFET